jgi:hypothetical protein
VFVVAPVVVSELDVDSPLLLHDQIKAADKQMEKESNFFFIKWFLCDELQKIYARSLLKIYFQKPVETIVITEMHFYP